MVRPSKPLPTDLEILNAIYDHHYNEFAFKAHERPRKTVLAIDISAIAEHLGVDADIVYGRLRYHLDERYQYQRDFLNTEGRVVRLFLAKVDFDLPADSVHFPYLASVLAELRADEKKRQTQVVIAWFSLGVSGLAVVISFVSLLFR